MGAKVLDFQYHTEGMWTLVLDQLISLPLFQDSSNLEEEALKELFLNIKYIFNLLLEDVIHVYNVFDQIHPRSPPSPLDPFNSPTTSWTHSEPAALVAEH